MWTQSLSCLLAATQQELSDGKARKISLSLEGARVDENDVTLEGDDTEERIVLHTPRKNSLVRPRLTYSQHEDILGALQAGQKWNGEWLSKIQLGLKREMNWINEGNINYLCNSLDNDKLPRQHVKHFIFALRFTCHYF